MSEVAFFREQLRHLPMLRVRGKIRMPDLTRWREELEGLAERAGGSAGVSGPVVLDMTTCSFFPSLALPPLLAAHVRLDKQAGSALFIAISEELQEILRCLHLGDHLRLFEDLDDCLVAAEGMES